MTRSFGWSCRACLVFVCLMSLAKSVAACAITCALAFAAGPRSLLEIIMVLPVIAIVAFVFLQAVRYTLQPGEQTPDHIKWRILQEDNERL